MSNTENNNIVAFNIKNYPIIACSESVRSNCWIAKLVRMQKWVYLQFQAGFPNTVLYGGNSFFISFSALRV